MSFISLILKYSFLQNAILICIFTSICCGILGTYIVYKKMVFLTSSISHASFGGIGIGIYLIYLLNLTILNPIYFAILFSALFAIMILYIKKESKLESDTAIGIIMAFGMALGILFIYITPGYQADVSTYLFGNILLGNKFNIFLLVLLDLIVITIFVKFNRAIKYLSFDEKFYGVLGVPVNFIDYLMIILVSVSIIVNIKSIGIVLIMSILTIPQAISAMLSNSYNKIAILSVIVSFISMIIGLYLSYAYRIPSGASIVLTLVVLFILVFLLKKISK